MSGPVPDLDGSRLDDPSPPSPDDRHRAEVARRSARIARTRRHRRGSAVVALLVVVGLGVAITAGHTASPGRHVTASAPTRPVPALGTATSSTPAQAIPRNNGQAAGASTAAPEFNVQCAAAEGPPTSGPWTGCEPAAPPGTGHGPGGRCDGSERSAPCGPGAVTGRAYAVSLPTGCVRDVVFAGHRWDATTGVPGPAGSTVHAWMRLVAPGRAESTGPAGTVEWLPAAAVLPACHP